MDDTEFLIWLWERKIYLTPTGDGMIGISAPKGQLTEQLRREVGRRKPTLLPLLAGWQARVQTRRLRWR